MIRDLVETVTRGWRLSRTAAVLAVSAALTLCSNPLAAQTSTTGVVVGKVTDQFGALVTRAEVVLTDTATNRARTQRTNEEGQFTFAGVTPGTYQLKVTAEGFKVSTLNPVIVEVNRSVTADVTLQVGEITSTVEVTSSVGAELQTVDAQLGNVLDQKMIRTLPTQTRNTLELLLLQPTTTPDRPTSPTRVPERTRVPGDPTGVAPDSDGSQRPSSRPASSQGQRNAGPRCACFGPLQFR